MLQITLVIQCVKIQCNLCLPEKLGQFNETDNAINNIVVLTAAGGDKMIAFSMPVSRNRWLCQCNELV